MLKVTVNRVEWLRGEGTEVSCLLRESDGKMCCLGFAALAEGCSTKEIAAKVGPCDLNADRLSMLKEDEWTETDVGNQLMLINDDMEISDKDRELRIIEEGAKAGIEFQFAGP